MQVSIRLVSYSASITSDTTEEYAASSRAIRARRRSPWTAWTLSGWCVAVLVLWLVDVGVWRFIRARGAGLSGDEPHYLVLARMLAHGSLHPFRFYQQDLKSHAYFAWPPDLLSTTANWHAFRGPHGLVSIHGLGLPALLAPFVAVGGRSGGIAGLMLVEAVGWVYLFARAADLVGLRRPARVVTMLALAGPAVWIASTQLYPDFMAGLLVGIALVEVAGFEVRGRLDLPGAAATVISLGLLPWLHIKNLAPGAIVVVALVVVAARAGDWIRASITLGLVFFSWLILLVYDLWGFGHVLGEPQPAPLPSWAALTHGLGLLFDRHQGALIQVPTVVLGICGLWVARKVAPVAVLGAILSVAVVVYLNASYVGVPYGGTAVAGRFSWSILAPLLLWTPFLLGRLRPLVRLWAVGGAVIAGWLLQAVPILANHHVYYNAQISGAPWDPSQYPGWWGPLNKILPELVPKGPLWGTPSWALVVAVLIGAAIGAIALLSAKAPAMPGPALASGFALLAVLIVAVAFISSPQLPSKPLHFAGHDVGSPLIAGASPASGATVPLQGVGSGTFTVTVDYQLRGAASATVYCTTGDPSHPGPPTSPATANLDSHRRSAVATVHCPAGLLWFQSAAQPNTRLDIASIVLKKVGT